LIGDRTVSDAEPEITAFGAAKAIAAIVAAHLPHEVKLERIPAIREAAGFSDA